MCLSAAAAEHYTPHRMTLFTLVWNYLKARPLNTAINIILLSLGIAVVTILLLFNTPLDQ